MKTARIGGILALLKEAALHIESAGRLSAAEVDQTDKANIDALHGAALDEIRRLELRRLAQASQT